MNELQRMLAIGGAVVALLALLALAAQFAAEPLETFVFYVLAGLMVVSCIAIAWTGNIVRAATWLLGALGSAAGLYLLLSANFLAAIQLIVYVGGILILLVFGVMLTARNPFAQFQTSRGEAWLIVAVGALLLAGLLGALLLPTWPTVPPASTPASADMRDLGRALLSDFLVPFEVVSVLLLAAMIGAACLARPEHK